LAIIQSTVALTCSSVSEGLPPLAGIGTRLRRANPLADAMPVLLADADALERGFRSFFPQLQAFAASHPIRVALQ
jgi:acyl carrier protein phosphodiesterase